MKRTNETAWLRKLAMTVMTAGAVLLMGIAASAAPTVSVSADKSNIQVSDTVTVTVQASQPEDDSIAPQIQVTYDPAILEYSSCDVECGGGGGQLTLTSLTANIQFTALAEGGAQVKAEATLSEDGGAPAESFAMVTVGTAGTAQDGARSSDATMRALSVSPGSMSPTFSPAVTEYTITIDDNTTDITVSGAVTDEKAQITAAYGFKNLKDGDNDAVITVTAEDESTLTYHFHIVRGDAAAAVVENTPDNPPAREESQMSTEGNALTVGAGAGAPATTSSGAMTFTVEGVTYQVAQGFETSLLPQGCLKTDVTVGGRTVQGASFDVGGLTLVYAVCGAGGLGDFYIYDDKAGSFSLFVQLPTGGSGYIVPLPGNGKVPDGFEAAKMQQGNTFVPAYQAAKSSDPIAKDFYLLYAVNETGDTGYYLYDALAGTCQRYVSLGGGAAKTSLSTSVIIGMLAIVLVGLCMVILFLAIRNKELARELEEKKAQIMPYMSEKRAKARAKEKEEAEPDRESDSDVEKAVKAAVKAQPKTAAEGRQPKAAAEAKLQTKTADGQQPKTKTADGQQPKTTAPVGPQDQAAAAQQMSDAKRTAGPQDEEKLGIEIKDVETYVAPSEAEMERQRALIAEQEEKLKAAHRAALEREIQKDEKARAKQEASEQKKALHMMKQVEREAEAERRAMEKLMAAEQLREQKLAMKKQQADTQPKSKTEKKQAEPLQIFTLDKPTDKQADKPVNKQMDKPAVSLTRKPAPNELDDDFEFEFINIDQD